MEIRADEDEQPHNVIKYQLRRADSKSPEYLSIGEVAEFLNVSRRTVTLYFENCPGVIDLIVRRQQRNGRRHRFLRIPRGTLNRFIQERRVR